jgi:hypothetical protein
LSEDSTIKEDVDIEAESDDVKGNEKPEVLTVNVDKTTLELIRQRMEGKYNEFWGDVIDDEQKRTIEIADKLSPGKPFNINGKDYIFQNVGIKKWRELTNMKTRADSEKEMLKVTDALTDYYLAMMKAFFNMTEDEADLIPPGEARMVGDGAAYRVLHPVPLHPERLRTGSTPTKT